MNRPGSKPPCSATTNEQDDPTCRSSSAPRSRLPRIVSTGALGPGGIGDSSGTRGLRRTRLTEGRSLEHSALPWTPLCRTSEVHRTVRDPQLLEETRGSHRFAEALLRRRAALARRTLPPVGRGYRASRPLRPTSGVWSSRCALQPHEALLGTGRRSRRRAIRSGTLDRAENRVPMK